MGIGGVGIGLQWMDIGGGELNPNFISGLNTTPKFDYNPIHHHGL